MANTFSLKVIACDRIFFDGRCTQVVLPLHDGEKAIQAHHENMVFAVEIGEIRITDENGKEITGITEPDLPRSSTIEPRCWWIRANTRRRLTSAVRRKQKSVPRSNSARSRVFQGIPRKSYGASESRQERYANRILIESGFLVIN